MLYYHSYHVLAQIIVSMNLITVQVTPRGQNCVRDCFSEDYSSLAKRPVYSCTCTLMIVI